MELFSMDIQSVKKTTPSKKTEKKYRHIGVGIARTLYIDKQLLCGQSISKIILWLMHWLLLRKF